MTSETLGLGRRLNGKPKASVASALPKPKPKPIKKGGKKG